MEMRFPQAEMPDHAALEKGRLLFAGETEFVNGVAAMANRRQQAMGHDALEISNVFSQVKGASQSSAKPA